MDKLKSSKIFLSILNTKKGQSQNNNGIEAFKSAQKDYNKLRELLNINWEDHIIEIIEEYSFKKLSENEIEKELFILKDYFGMTNISESEVINRKNRLMLIIKKKEEIINILTNSFNFILEFVTQDITNNLYNLKDTIIKNINLTMINKFNNNNLIEKYFLNLSENTGNFSNNTNQPLIEELTNEKEKNKILNEKIQLLEFKLSTYNINNPISNNSDFGTMKLEEETFSVIFQTGDQSITRSFTCKKNYLLVDLEKKFYNEYKKYKELETYLLCNGNKIFRFKTLEENKIKDSDIIIININEM
jgi:hypothetical protein